MYEVPFYKKYSHMKQIFLFLAGKKASLLAIGAMLLLSLPIGLLPKTPSYIWVSLGVVVLFFLLCLLAVISKRMLHFRMGFRDMGFMFLHIGLFLSVLSLGLSQISIQRLYMPLYEGQISNRAYDAQGYIYQVPFTIQLDSFAIDYYENEEIKTYTSWLEIERKNKKTIKTDIQVNKPLAVSEWMIYQYSYRSSEGEQAALSQLMLVRDIWKWFTYTGLILCMIGCCFLFMIKKA